MYTPACVGVIFVNKFTNLWMMYVGTTNKEFNFRHDWNSLISDDESVMMRHYSKDYFPPADTYVRYTIIYSGNRAN